jgi:hypothetical protein
MYFLSWPPYMSVYGFWKNLNFHQFGEKLTKTLYFLAVTPIFPISYTLRYRIWVFMGFTPSKYVGVTLDFTEITTLGAKTYWNSVFFGRDPHILDWLYIAGPYMSFFKFWKIDFFSKSIYVILQFYWKSPVWGQKQIETPYFLVVIGIWWIGYT